VLDPQGGNPKVRPLVIVTPTAEISNTTPLVAVAITSEFSQPEADDEVAMPFDPRGRVGSGLKVPCVAKCRWQCILTTSEIIERKGYISTDKLTEILNKLADIEAESA
jgi:mRNA-degrading endonuclease toxin of MazEF toxin-antitoxin module